ncbi:hypothetical protein JMUB7518_27830 [Staphylococcus aureus]
MADSVKPRKFNIKIKSTSKHAISTLCPYKLGHAATNASAPDDILTATVSM